MLRQFVQGSVLVGDIAAHGLAFEAGWQSQLLSVGCLLALFSAIGIARRISAAIACPAPIEEQL